jgi:hypothetical protein
LKKFIKFILKIVRHNREFPIRVDEQMALTYLLISHPMGTYAIFPETAPLGFLALLLNT